MGFSEEADQQRRREAKALRRFVGISLAGSLLTHGLIVALPVRETASPPRRIEIAVVPPRPSPSPPLPSPSPPVDRPVDRRPREPERVQRPIEPRPPIPEAIASPATTLPPEGSPDATVNESPLVGSGLAPGTGGFSEGIGLNQSDSPIRGEGGGDRQGVPGGVPGSIAPSPEPQATAPASPPAPPVVVDRPPPVDPAPLQVVCRRCPEPDYPRSALQAGIEGRVRATVDVDRRGRVTGVRLVQPSGDRALDEAVLATVRERWRFEDIEGGASNVPVEVYMTVSDSELNQQAQQWGDRTAVRVPSSGFAAPTPQTPAATRPPSDRPASEPDEDRSPPAPRPPAEPPATPSAAEPPEPPQPEASEPEPESEPELEPEAPNRSPSTPEPAAAAPTPAPATPQANPNPRPAPNPRPTPEARPEPRPTQESTREREPVRPQRRRDRQPVRREPPQEREPAPEPQPAMAEPSASPDSP